MAPLIYGCGEGCGEGSRHVPSPHLTTSTQHTSLSPPPPLATTHPQKGKRKYNVKIKTKKITTYSSRALATHIPGFLAVSVESIKMAGWGNRKKSQKRILSQVKKAAVLCSTFSHKAPGFCLLYVHLRISTPG